MNNLVKELNEAMDKLDESIEWNYGHVGNDPRANECLEKVQELKELLKATNEEEYNKFIQENE